ncbi:hypothetical protein AB0F36_02625 [Streptomyces sp. NPDC029080]|uniref:hypothetical protein n=1 Tax=Streptomyces sp. NPDC029080 TaxID=3155017 RepID=UPI0033E6C8D1
MTGQILPTSEQLRVLLTALDVTEAASSGWRIALNRIVARRFPELFWSGWCGCPDGDPAVMAFLERRDRDEGIKRKTGQLRQDEDYEEWLEARVARAFYRRRWDYLDEDELARFEWSGGHAPLGGSGLQDGRPSASDDSLFAACGLPPHLALFESR